MVTNPCSWCGKQARHNGKLCNKCALLKSRYGITFAERMALEKSQKGRCAICGVIQKNFHLDHNHETGKIRGLLCIKCNLALGAIENKWLLAAALAYLSLHDKSDEYSTAVSDSVSILKADTEPDKPLI